MRILPSACIALIAAVAPTAGGGGAVAASSDVPVLVELFTSEGCSSCPPADGVLARLLADPPHGVRVIALGEHVDYWDGLGWKDEFSAPGFTRRQQAYVHRFGLSGPYTPQLVVAGRRELLGGDERAARDAISAAARERGGVAEVEVQGAEGGDIRLEVRAEWGGSGPGDVLVAVVQDHARDRITSGENAGRVLDHVAVVRWLTRVASGTRGYRGTVRVPLAAAEGSDRVVVIVQGPQGGPVRAVATAKLE